MRGTRITCSACSPTSSLPSVATAITWAPRARTSCMFERIFSSTGQSVATQTTGVRLVEQRDRAVLHLAGGVGVGRDVGDLLQLQRALEADRRGRCGGRGRGRSPSSPVARRRSPRSRGSTCASSSSIWCGMRLSSATSSRAPLGVERAAQLGEPQRRAGTCRDLADEGLGRGDADLEPGAGEEHGVGVARRLAAHDVGDASTVAPRSRASRIAASVSAVSPDWVMPITRSPGPTTGLR